MRIFRGRSVGQTIDPDQTPDLSDEPTAGQHPLARALHLQGAHRNLYVSTDGTWANYLCDDIDIVFKTLSHRTRLMGAQRARYAQLLGSTMRIRGTSSPFNHRQWAQRLDEDHPVRGAETSRRALSRRLPDSLEGRSYAETLAAGQEWFIRNGIRKSSTIISVRITTDKVDIEDLPLLLGRDTILGKKSSLEQHRRRLREITTAMAGEGFGAFPMNRPAHFGWLVHSSLGMGAPVPPMLTAGDRDSVMPEEVPGFTNPVFSTHAPRAATTTVRTRRLGVDYVSHVAVLHAERFERRDLKDPTRMPFLAWLQTLPYPVEYVMEIDLLAGKDVKEQAEYDKRLALNLESHFRDHDEEPSAELGRGIQRAREVIDEVTTGDPATAGRARGVLLVAVTGDTEDDALDRVRTLVSDASEKQGILFAHDYGQWESYRSFTPGEPIARTGYVTQMPLSFLCSALPNASAAAGDTTGWIAGLIRGGHDAMLLDSHGGSRRGGSNLMAIGGDQGAGKSTLAGALLHWNAIHGVRCVGLDPAKMWRHLGDVNALKDDFRHLDVTSMRPGAMSPTLEPEPLRELFSTEEEYKGAVTAAKQQRMNLLIDAFTQMLPYAMVSTDTTGAVARTIQLAVTRVGGEYGTSPWEYVDMMPRVGGEVGGMIAEALTSRSTMRDGSLVFPINRTKDLDPEYGQALMEQATLTILSLGGIALPPKGNNNRATWRQDQQEALPILNLAARFAARTMYADRNPAVVALDEIGPLIEPGSSFSAFLTQASVETRRLNTLMMLLFQNPSMLFRIDDEISNLVGSAVIGRMEEDAARAALRLLRLKEGHGWEQSIASQGKGEFTIRTWAGHVRQIYNDRSWWDPELLTALDTNPEGEGTYDVRTRADDMLGVLA